MLSLFSSIVNGIMFFIPTNRNEIVVTNAPSSTNPCITHRSEPILFVFINSIGGTNCLSIVSCSTNFSVSQSQRKAANCHSPPGRIFQFPRVLFVREQGESAYCREKYIMPAIGSPIAINHPPVTSIGSVALHTVSPTTTTFVLQRITLIARFTWGPKASPTNAWSNTCTRASTVVTVTTTLGMAGDIVELRYIARLLSRERINSALNTRRITTKIERDTILSLRMVL